MRRKKIGTVDFHGSVDITDPCYNRDVWCRMTDVKIRNGVYTCIAWHHKDKGTFDNGEPYCYDVIGIIGIYFDGVIPCQKEMKEIGSIGVDAGLAGFFHNKPDYTDDELLILAPRRSWRGCSEKFRMNARRKQLCAFTGLNTEISTRANRFCLSMSGI